MLIKTLNNTQTQADTKKRQTNTEAKWKQQHFNMVDDTEKTSSTAFTQKLTAVEKPSQRVKPWAPSIRPRPRLKQRPRQTRSSQQTMPCKPCKHTNSRISSAVIPLLPSCSTKPFSSTSNQQGQNGESFDKQCSSEITAHIQTQENSKQRSKGTHWSLEMFGTGVTGEYSCGFTKMSSKHLLGPGVGP